MSEASPAPERVALYVCTPEDVLYSGPAHWVQIPLHDGLIGIWPGHAPLIASLATGTLTYQVDEGPRKLDITGGILRVGLERCAVLVHRVMPPGSSDDAAEVDASDTEQLAAALEEALHESLSDDELRELERE